MRVAGPDGAKEQQIVLEVHPLAAVLRVQEKAVQVHEYICGYRDRRKVRKEREAAQRLRKDKTETDQGSIKHEQHSEAGSAQPQRTSLPMARKLMFQGSRWPIEARTAPHLLHRGERKEPKERGEFIRGGERQAGHCK